MLGQGLDQHPAFLVFVIQPLNRAALGWHAALDQHGEEQRLLLAVMELVHIDAQRLPRRGQHAGIDGPPFFDGNGGPTQLLDHILDEPVFGFHDLRWPHIRTGVMFSLSMAALAAATTGPAIVW